LWKRDPSQESVKLAKKITEMAKAINKSFYYVLNKIDEETKEVLLKSVDKNKVIASQRIREYLKIA